MEKQFIGEHLLPGHLGHLLVIIAFVASLFSIFAFLKSALKEETIPEESRIWKWLGRVGFSTLSLCILGVFIALYYIISHHLFEYHYAWEHSSTGLKTKYLLASFWEGSEGSFLLWIFWICLLGIIVLFTGKKWESRVMVTVSIVQAILCTMLLGIYLGPDIRIGSTPFALLRDTISAPIFSRPDYLKFIEDGNGLNPLLQNYWMVIHPPVLFLGFALTTLPFAYTIAALWNGKYKEWVKPTLRWSLVTGGILILGISMGGAWAYESLNFGGYWAWDPVENASFVPWLVTIAAIHTLLIYKSTGRSLKITLIFYILTFLLIWYSTFLTRTGILGDSSVHAFTGKGKTLYWHLIIAMGLYLAGSLGLLVKRWRKMPRVAGEEEVNTREFWMLIGSVFLLLAAVQIIFYTSLPVWAPLYNKFSGTEIAPPEDPVSFYNNIQVWFAILVGILSGAIQFLKYKKTGMKVVWIRLGLLTLISIFLTVLLCMAQSVKPIQLILFTFAGIFTIIANGYYILTIQKRKLFKSGASIAHIGFGLIIVGLLLSGYKKHVISIDSTGATRNWDFGKKTFEENLKESRENVLMFRNSAIPMGNYMVTYLGDSVVQNDPPITYFKINYRKINPKTGDVDEDFMLYPDAFVNPKGQQGLSSNPSTRHYLTHDVFSYISSISDPEQTDTSSFHTLTANKNDTLYVSSGYLVYRGLSREITHPDYQPEDGVIAVQANLDAYSLAGKLGSIHPLYLIQGAQAVSPNDSLRELGLVMHVERIHPDDGSIDFGIKQRAQQDDYVVMKVIVFPYVGVLWAGIIIMVLGFCLSFLYRISK